VARSAYILGLNPAAGKSVVVLGAADVLSGRIGRLAAFRPLVSDAGRDPLLASLRDRYDVGVPYDRMFGVTCQQATGLLADGRAIVNTVAITAIQAAS
jgi:phosphate acetyltransferase